MAKLSDVRDNKPIPLSVDGMFINNLPAKEMEEKFGNIQQSLLEDQNSVLVAIFSDLICDSEGKPFEDCSTPDEIMAVLSVKDIQAILYAVTKALSPDATGGK